MSTRTEPTPAPTPAPTPSTDRAPARSSGVRVLVWINAALLIALALVTLSPRATAQQDQARPSGKYMVIAAKPISGNSNVVYVIDSVNAEMVALMWNQSRRSVDGVGFRDMDDDLKRTPKR